MAFPVDKNVEFGYFLQLYVKLINLKIYYYYYEQYYKTLVKSDKKNKIVIMLKRDSLF